MAVAKDWTALNKISDKIKAKVKLCKFCNDRTYCVLVDEDVLAFGNNRKGLLGLGHKNTIGAEGGKIVELSGQLVMDIVDGRDYVVALTALGRVYIWGESSFGLLGPNVLISVRPVLIDNFVNIVDIKCGLQHIMAADKTGRVYAWGSNRNSQVGSGFVDDQAYPFHLSSLDDKNVTQIAAGPFSSMACTTDGDVYVWGWLVFFRTSGIKTLDKPTKLSLNMKIKSVACSYANAFFLDTEGLLYMFTPNSGPKVINNQSKMTIDQMHLITYNTFMDCEHFEDYMLLVHTKESPDVTYIMGHTATKRLEQLEPVGMSCEETIIGHCRYQASPFMVEYHGETREFGQKKLTKAIVDSFDQPDKSDVAFTFAGGEKIHANRLVLNLGSSHMRTLLGKWHPSQKEIAIEHYPYDIYHAYLKWIYTERLPIEAEGLDKLIELFDLANCNFEHELKATVMGRIKRKLNLDTCCSLFDFSIQYELSEFRDYVTHFIHRYLASIDRQHLVAMSVETSKQLLLSLHKVST